MPVTHVTTDPVARSIVITAEFAAPVERVWELYADPRQLEQVFGPPSHPATFVEHELVEGSTRATFTSIYASAEASQQVLDKGVEERATQSINQIDAFLAA